MYNNMKYYLITDGSACFEDDAAPHDKNGLVGLGAAWVIAVQQGHDVISMSQKAIRIDSTSIEYGNVEHAKRAYLLAEMVALIDGLNALPPGSTVALRSGCKQLKPTIETRQIPKLKTKNRFLEPYYTALIDALGRHTIENAKRKDGPQFSLWVDRESRNAARGPWNLPDFVTQTPKRAP